MGDYSTDTFDTSKTTYTPSDTTTDTSETPPTI
jgi:hypothetical protein